ncbi:PREDICTED: uncharacterized protein LOC106819472 [Priapulus caudatus]|uniref:Uncharacterized protein LOC106819472 n=1 Tax=Priapulus caudatus TaxID=37621 RepID=A0ABM1F564_PRICU|nr:PREDICTED: uncharacterized protein LOC106819472 [Priapulus caudatus]
MSQDDFKFLRILLEEIHQRDDGYYENDAHSPSTDAPSTDAHSPSTDAHSPSTDAHSPSTDTELDYPDMKNIFWTDSKVVLGYIQNRSKRFHMYVANRVQTIRQSSDPDQWNYVSTHENPADHASRGLTAEEIESSNWLKGPAFLWEKEISLQKIDVNVAAEDIEVKSTVRAAQKSSFTSFEERVSRFSTYNSAVKAVSVIVNCSLRRAGIELSKLETQKVAEKNLICVIQEESFPEELTRCRKGSSALSKTGSLKDLDPFIGKDNLLRVGGRLMKAPMMYGVKHPIILPRHSHLSSLIASHCHQRITHQGRHLTINDIRASGFWILGCRSVVSSMINKCVRCIRARGSTLTQKMPDLPKERIEPSPPFTYCGLDCFGPYIIKEGRKELKRYGLIITCLAMKGVHIEMLDDMSTDSFLNALRCFIALRGRVRLIRCDQETNFIGAKHELKECLKELDSDHIVSKLRTTVRMRVQV